MFKASGAVFHHGGVPPKRYLHIGFRTLTILLHTNHKIIHCVYCPSA